MSDYLTLLSPLDGSPTVKRLYLGQSGEILSTPAPLSTWYRAGEVPVDSFTRLATILEATSQDPAWYLVRGAILPTADRSRMRRTHVNEPTLRAEPRRWVLLDLDKWRLDVPASEFAADPAKYAQEARSALPPCFRYAACWWQATGSAGVKSGVRLRLAFWVNRPMADEEWKAWIRDWEVPVDGALFTPSQPHFTGRPLLDGVPDPVPGKRSGVLPGIPEVVIPDLLDGDRVLTADEELTKAIRRVKRTDEGERRTMVNRLAFQLAVRFAEDELTAARIQTSLLEAARTSGLPDHEATVTLGAAVREGREKRAAERAGWRSDLATGKDGHAKSTAANVAIYLANHPEYVGRLVFDERAQRPLWTEPPPWGGQIPRPLGDEDDVEACKWLQTQAGIDAKLSWIRPAFVAAAKQRSFDPIQDYLNRLPRWDGASRLDTLLIRHLGVQDTALNRAQTRAWFIQAVRRAYAESKAPVQADYLIVLSGPQGLRKSSLLRALCPLPRFFRDDLPDIGSKDARAAVADSWIVELSELTHRKADRDAFKAFITARVDKFRPAYARNEVELPRRAVLVGSTNEDEFLTDPSGNRRFWPMECTRRADIDEVIAERDQFWAEAMSRAEAGELAYLPQDLEEEAKRMQAEYREEDAVETQLEETLRRPTGGPFDVTLPPELLGPGKVIVRISVTAACDLVRLDAKRPGDMSRVKWALKRLGWTQKKTKGRRFWHPPVDWQYELDQTKSTN